MESKENVEKLEPHGEDIKDTKEGTGTFQSAAEGENSSSKVHEESTQKALNTKCPEYQSEVQVQFQVISQHDQGDPAAARQSVPMSGGHDSAPEDLETSVPATPEALDGKSRLGFAISDSHSKPELVEATEWGKSPDRDTFWAQHGRYALVITKNRFPDLKRPESGHSSRAIEADEELTLLSPGLLDLFRRVVSIYPGIRTDSNRITIKHPYEPLFFYMNDICELARRQPEVAGNDIDCLVDAYQKYIRADHQLIRELTLKNVIDYTSLWAIFKPGDCIYSSDESGLPCLRVLTAVEYRKGESHLPMPPHPNSDAKFCADMWSIGWDPMSEKFRRYLETRPIGKFTGICDIKALPFYPLNHFGGGSIDIVSAFRQSQQQKGRKWKKLVSEPPSCYSYSGPMYQNDGRDAINTHERVIVDASPNVVPLRNISIGNGLRGEMSPFPDRHRRVMGGTTGSRRYEDEPPVMTVGFSDEYSDFDDFDPKKDFNDLQAQICPPTLRCYGLKSCKMFEADVARLADVKWDTGSLNHLELDMNTKGLLRSVVEQHKKNSDHSVRDVIQGKEKGLVIALHGPPGVGKTLTAETIAEYAQKPLLPINTGDLTGDVDVLACLNQVFCLAARWDAILLLDGADDLLKKRSYEDLGSNSLVSIFLRMLEYFEGIMFMTTNRVETIDLAFQSRIDIAIKYDTLTPEKRRRIWERFIDRLDEREEEAKSELRDKLDDIQEWELNGRQIRNVLAIAESTALNDQRRRGALRYRHIETIANETLDFQNFLQNSHKQRKKHAEAGRYVTALQAAAFSGKEDVVRQLIQRGATVNATGGIFETALQAASHQGHDNVVRLLLKAGADANIKVGEYSNAITAAFRKGNWSTVDILREITAEVDMQAGIEASHGAAAQRSVDLSEQLQTILTAKPQPMTIFAFFTWEIPAVISIGNVRPANPPLASEQSKLRNHVTLVKRHVMNAAGERTILLEALTCLSYVKQRWGALGEQVLNDVIWICSQEVGQHNECSYQSSDNRLEYSLDTTESSICITINPVKFGAGSGSVLQVVDFLCKAVRLPQDQGGQPGIVISSSTCRVPRVNEGGKLLAQDSSSGRDVLLSCDLSTHPITGLKDECWEYLFESCYIVEDNQLEQSKRVLGKGLKMPFDLMVTLAGTGYQVDVAGGIILTGYSTALIPTHLEDEYAQFHLVVDNLEVNQRKQINPFLLSEVPRELVTDLKIFATLPCFLGWCESAQIKLGSRDLLESTLPEANITYSNSKQRGKVLQFTGINAGLQAASAAPLQAGGNLALNYSVASLRLRFGAEAEYLAMILRASQEIVLICDVAKNRSWLLPKLSLLLHMAHIWHKKYVQNSCHSPDPIPFVSPHDEEIDVVLALKSHGGIPVIEQGDDSFKLRTLMLGLNINLQDSLPLLELQQSKGDNLFGFEVMDVVTEPPRGCNPRKVKIGSSHSWVALANNADAVLTCANLGEAIAPKFCATRPNPKCNYLKANKGYLAAHVSVLCLLADRTGKDHGLLLEDPGIPIPDDHRYLSITGNPFAVCNHGINDAQNCWERKDMLQKLTSQRSFAAIFGTQLPVHPQNLCVKGALVFGGN